MWFILVYNNVLLCSIQMVQQQYAMTNKDICCDAYAMNKIGMWLMRCVCEQCVKKEKCFVIMQDEKCQFFKSPKNETRKTRPYGEGMTAANSLPGENQSLADLSLLFVVRRRMPTMFFS